MEIPDAERAVFASQILNYPDCLDPIAVAEEYRKQGLQVIQDPSSATIAEKIIAALNTKKPFSAVRIGDGEANLLTYNSYSTPIIDTEVARLILTMQTDNLEATNVWLKRLSRMMHVAIMEADIVGVRGLWYSKGNHLQKQDAISLYKRVQTASTAELRGLTGMWRATDYMIQLAQKGALKNKLVCSAHFYLSILNNLKLLLSHAPHVVLISENSDILTLFQNRYPSTRFDAIAVGKMRDSSIMYTKTSRKLAFLGSTFKELPKDLTGILCLVAGGIWAEIYCTWIRKRGGVGVDIGSGMDLLAGQCTRPFHRNLGLDRDHRFSLRSYLATD